MILYCKQKDLILYPNETIGDTYDSFWSNFILRRYRNSAQFYAFDGNNMSYLCKRDSRGFFVLNNSKHGWGGGYQEFKLIQILQT